MKIKNEAKKLKKERTGMTRKEFLGTGLTAAAAFTVIPAHVLAGNGKISPSNKLNIAA